MMIWLPELGTLMLIMALWLSLFNAFQKKPRVLGTSFLLFSSFLLLGALLLNCDFSVAYVANHSNTHLPWYYRFSALWGAHEGSMLLWVLCLNLWILVVNRLKHWSSALKSMTIRVLLSIQSLFTAFIVFTSNPFSRLLPWVPKEGMDLNPLLQDIGLITHPPILYMGYVGFSVPFSIILAVLILKRPYSTEYPWTYWIKPWVSLALAFLTLGITLGSWWAYYELGWGGWWFWDPVENASLMPWLLGVGLVHLLWNREAALAYQRLIALLAISTFALSVMGTFLVRSGSITSVHSFSSDPKRGIFILAILSILLLWGYSLYALRAENVLLEKQEGLTKKAKGIFLSAILWSGACFTVILGTLYPMMIEALGLAPLSVGAPYFEITVIPWLLPLIFLAAILPYSKVHYFLLCISIVIAIVTAFLFAGTNLVGFLIGVSLGLYLLLSTLLLRTSRRSIPLILSHSGFALLVLGVSLSTHWSIEKEAALTVGESFELTPFTFEFKSLEPIKGDNFNGVEAQVRVSKNGHFYRNLFPQKRYFPARDIAMTETALNPSLWNELYVALSQPLDEGAWAFRFYWKPFVRLIWIGGAFMALGLLWNTLARKIRRLFQ